MSLPLEKLVGEANGELRHLSNNENRRGEEGPVALWRQVEFSERAVRVGHPEMRAIEAEDGRGVELVRRARKHPNQTAIGEVQFGDRVGVGVRSPQVGAVGGEG